MPSKTEDLVSMADIARLAGQSRAVVGNWKARAADFPVERGRNSRGPLYSRPEVEAWLTARGVAPATPGLLWGLHERLRGVATTDALTTFELALLALGTVDAEAYDVILRDPARSAGAMAERLDSIGQGAAAHIGSRLSNRDATMVAETMRSLAPEARRALATTVLAQAERHEGLLRENVTPSGVRHLLLRLVPPRGTVYIPAFGIGQLAIDAAATAVPSPVSILGQEVMHEVHERSSALLAIFGTDAEVALGDVLVDDAFPALRADTVYAVPPWNVRHSRLQEMGADPRWVWGEPGAIADAAWIQHCLYHLAPGGTAAIVIARSPLFASGRLGQIRQRLVKAGLVEAVIGLPKRTFTTTNIPPAVLVLRSSNVPASQSASVLVVELDEPRSDGSNAPADRGLAEALADRVADTYHAWRTGTQIHGPGVAEVTFDEIAANNFILDPARYVSFAASQEDESVADRRRQLVDRVRAQFASAAAADAALAELLWRSR